MDEIAPNTTAPSSPIPDDSASVPPPPLRRIRFAAIGEAWAFVNAERATWAAISLLYMILYLILLIFVERLLIKLGVPPVPSLRYRPFALKPNFMPERILYQFLSFAIRLPATAFLGAGAYRMALKQIRGGKIRVTDIFRGGNAFGPMIGASLLEFILIYGFLIYTYFPGRLLSGVFLLATPIVADRRAGAIDAMKLSFRALKGQVFASLVLYFLVIIVGVSGILGLGVGILFTFPLIYLVPAIVYRDFFGREPAPQEPLRQIQMPFPPQYPVAAPTEDDGAA